MAEKTGIEWTDATWNPWQGCTKVSPACANCYMFTDLKRYGRDGSIVIRSKPPTFNLPMKKNRVGEFAIAPGKRVFTCSWSDWFHKTADPWRDEAWAIIRQRPDVTFQIVTKRTERIAECLPSDWGNGYSNVWLIATVENQELANIRITQLLSVPSVIRGLSIEPLLGPIDLSRLIRDEWHCPRCKVNGWFHRKNPGIRNACATCGSQPVKVRDGIDWVIVGGESGPNARPCHPDWVRSIRDQCVAAGVPFFFKQWGEWLPVDHLLAGELRQWGPQINSQEAISGTKPTHVKVGKKYAGNLLDGVKWSQFPEVAHA